MNLDDFTAVLGKLLVEKWRKTSKPISADHGYQAKRITIGYKGQNSELIIDVNFAKKEDKLGSSSVGALKKHELSEDHKTNVNNLKVCHDLCSSNNATLWNSSPSLLHRSGKATSHNEINVSVIENTSLQSTQNQNSVILSFINGAKPEPEIIWCLFCVRHGFSDNSMTSFVSTLSRMFSGVDNVKNLIILKGIITCYVNYGIYLYFKDYVKFEVNNLPFIVTCFDESSNKKNSIL